MFSAKYLKKRFLYHGVDTFSEPSGEFKFSRYFIQLNSSNVNSYGEFLKFFLVLKFFAVLKTPSLGMKQHIKKRQVKDLLSFLLISKTLLVKGIWSSSKNMCTEFRLENLSVVPVLGKIFFISADLLKVPIKIRLFSSQNNWVFNTIFSIDRD